jgi:hypothetical protein
MFLLDVDSGVVRFAGLLQIVCHWGPLQVGAEALQREYRLRGEVAYEPHCEARQGACVWIVSL